MIFFSAYYEFILQLRKQIMLVSTSDFFPLKIYTLTWFINMIKTTELLRTLDRYIRAVLSRQFCFSLSFHILFLSSRLCYRCIGCKSLGTLLIKMRTVNTTLDLEWDYRIKWMKTAGVLELRIANQYCPLILLIKEQKARRKEMRMQHLKPPLLYGSTVYFLVYSVLVIVRYNTQLFEVFLH